MQVLCVENAKNEQKSISKEIMYSISNGLMVINSWAIESYVKIVLY